MFVFLISNRLKLLSLDVYSLLKKFFHVSRFIFSLFILPETGWAIIKAVCTQAHMKVPSSSFVEIENRLDVFVGDWLHRTDEHTFVIDLYYYPWIVFLIFHFKESF